MSYQTLIITLTLFIIAILVIAWWLASKCKVLEEELEKEKANNKFIVPVVKQQSASLSEAGSVCEQEEIGEQMTDVENLKKVKAVINDLPSYMEYLPTKEQEEAFDVVLELLNEAIEKATVLCKDCKHYIQTDPEWHCGQCKYHINGTFAADTCDQGERKEENEDFGHNSL